tara:strand:+ start:1512 stop:2663 length:1152 start_codon:yes stop_codon:yes gene_type:complete
VLAHNPNWPSKCSVHFVHNWRCAGTTINSILSSNFHNRYLKVGHPFNIFGWPHDYDNHPDPLLTVGQIRNLTQSFSPSPVILGGHTFFGLDSFLPGRFDIWMNYREPLQRLNSGILRFYNKQFAAKPGDSNLIQIGQSLQSTNLDLPDFVDRLLSTTLKRESNGIARRLAALSLTTNIVMNQDSNVETVDFLLSDYSDKDLFDCALSNLPRIKLLINSSHIQASLLCIERIYELSSPLINPFSNLSHNPITLSGAKANDTSVMDNCKEIITRHSSVDLKLMPYLHSIFAQQVNDAKIDEKEVAVRAAMHRERLLLPKWFSMKKFSSEDRIRLVSESLENRCKQYQSLDDDILKLFFSWNGLTPNFRQDVNKFMTDKYSRQAFI